MMAGPGMSLNFFSRSRSPRELAAVKPNRTSSSFVAGDAPGAAARTKTAQSRKRVNLRCIKAPQQQQVADCTGERLDPHAFSRLPRSRFFLDTRSIGAPVGHGLLDVFA